MTAMNIVSRIRRSLLRDTKNPKSEISSIHGSKIQQLSSKEENDDELLGVTVDLVDHLKSFTVETFKTFPVQDEESTVNHNGDADNGTISLSNVKKDLSDWQEKHAVLVLSKSKELSQLRFKLCPRVLKEQQFWRTYFKLVRNLVAEYELRAIQQAKIRRMAMEEDEALKTMGVHEVEMAETSCSSNSLKLNDL